MITPNTMRNPFDAVLLISFGGPQGLDEIRPFLRNVLRGRSIPETRLEAVAKHYEGFAGMSPLTSITMQQTRSGTQSTTCLRRHAQLASLP